MELDQLKTFFATNPSARLLRSAHAPHIVYFLNEQFKASGNLSVAHSQLLLRLRKFLDDLHETEAEVLRDAGETYLAQWSAGETRWMRRYYDAQHAESVYQLTPAAEDVLKFLSEVLQRNLGFVGAESRLTRIIDTLTEITVRGSDDPQQRLEHLQAERDRIDREIESIAAGNEVSTHSPTAIRERFADVVADLNSLQGDFRAVEESFKAIARDVQKQQNEAAGRGEILGYVLDAEDRLKQEDQGASFQAFVRLILSQSQQDALEEMIAQLDQMDELTEHLDGRQRLKGMIDRLSAEAQKVLDTTRRLSSTLRRVLDAHSRGARQRLGSVLREIQMLAVRAAEDPPDIGIEVFSEFDLLNVWQRTFWQAPVAFDHADLANKQTDEVDRARAFRRLAEMERLDWSALRSRIADVVAEEDCVRLPELLERHPATGGSIELLGYIQLAHEDGHYVDQDQREVVGVEADGRWQSFEVPRVVFLSPDLRSKPPLAMASGAAL